jgi:hypothetical protein
MESVESRDEIMLTVILENGDEETVDRTTRALLNELRDADLTVGLAGTGADPFAGAKSGDWLAVGTIGSSDPSEAMPGRMAATRAANTKNYLVIEKGIDAGRIRLLFGQAGAKKVETMMSDTDITIPACARVPL